MMQGLVSFATPQSKDLIGERHICTMYLPWIYSNDWAFQKSQSLVEVLVVNGERPTKFLVHGLDCMSIPALQDYIMVEFWEIRRGCQFGPGNVVKWMKWRDVV